MNATIQELREYVRRKEAALPQCANCGEVIYSPMEARYEPMVNFWCDDGRASAYTHSKGLDEVIYIYTHIDCVAANVANGVWDERMVYDTDKTA